MEDGHTVDPDEHLAGLLRPADRPGPGPRRHAPAAAGDSDPSPSGAGSSGNLARRNRGLEGWESSDAAVGGVGLADKAVTIFAALVNLVMAAFFVFGGAVLVLGGHGPWKVVGAGLIAYGLYGLGRFVLRLW